MFYEECRLLEIIWCTLFFNTIGYLERLGIKVFLKCLKSFLMRPFFSHYSVHKNKHFNVFCDSRKHFLVSEQEIYLLPLGPGVQCCGRAFWPRTSPALSGSASEAGTLPSHSWSLSASPRGGGPPATSVWTLTLCHGGPVHSNPAKLCFLFLKTVTRSEAK